MDTMFYHSIYMWLLWLLYADLLSSENISGCELQPCQNSGTCEPHNGGFRCLCSQKSHDGLLYGGENCTVALTGCDDNRCENGGICVPLLVNNQQTFTCACLAGFTHSKCETPTAFSFESAGYVHIETQLVDRESPFKVKFSFKTARPLGTILQHRVDDLLHSITLKDGHLCLHRQEGQASSTLLQELPEYLSNNKWHTVEASLGGVVSQIRLICIDGDCLRNSDTEGQLLERTSVLPTQGTSSQSLYIGAAEGTRRLEGAVDEAEYFLGCFRDVLLESRLVLPAFEDSEARSNVTVGCSDKDECESSPCQNQGRCVIQGSKDYICECPRPYEGHNCAEEYVPVRFGNKDLDSYAVFSLDDDPGDTLAISMFLRTRHFGGLLLILANSTSQYLRLWLEDGRVKAQVNNSETLFGQTVVNDGHFHLLTLTVHGVTATLSQSTQVMDSISVKLVHAQPGDLVFIGGLPDSKSSAEFGGYFKGCLQDLRINSKKLQFYPMETSVKSYRLENLMNVERGCSSDDACAVSPCLNGGVCYTTWDSFTCDCPPNTAGRHCDIVKWCELSPCPSGTICELRLEGFECLSNVTLHDESSILHYQSNGKISQSLTNVVLLSFCSGQSTATLLFSQQGSAQLTVFLTDSHLVMELKTGPNILTVQSKGAVSDGVWHTVKISMESKTQASCRWIMDVDGDQGERSTSTTCAENLDFLKQEGTDIFLGGKNLGNEVKFSGCLGAVEIGGLPLPFHQETELNFARPQKEQLVKINSDDAQQPCGSCASNPCHNNGSCVHVSGGFRCRCQAGHRGERYDAEVDTCENNNCSRSSTCLKGIDTYTCLCPQNTTGPYCNDEVPELPWYIEIDPLPQFPVAACEGTRWEYNCYHGGTCSEFNNTCHCQPGFTGQWCEKDVDECVSEPCMNAGVCVNLVNSFQCVCDLNHSGVHCQIDVSDFYMYLFLGLWQNLFQVASYLLIRLDDGPEIDWVFHIND